MSGNITSFLASGWICAPKYFHILAQRDQRGVALSECWNWAEVNGDFKGTNERGSSLVGSLGSSCRYKRLLSCLGCSGQPSTKYFFFSPYNFSIYVSPSPSNLDTGQAVVQGRLTLNVYLRSCLSCFPSLVLASSHGLCVCEETFFWPIAFSHLCFAVMHK